MTNVDVFGRSTKNSKSASVLKVLSNGGLSFINDVLGIKLDPNTNNVLRVSANGLMGNGIKATGAVMTGNLSMSGNKVTDIDTTYPPQTNSQATSWNQVKQLVTDYSNLSWSLNGNSAGVNASIGTLDNFDVKLVRNKQNYLTLKSNEILMNKNVDMSNFKVKNLIDPTDSKDATTKDYVDIKRVKNNCGFIPPLTSNSSKQGFIVTTNGEHAWTVFSIANREWATNGVQVNSYIQIQLPYPVAIWSFAVRGKQSGGEKWHNWTFEGSNDGVAYNILRTATGDYLGNTTKHYTLTHDQAKYLYYRFYGVQGEPTNPGLSYLQIYSIDELL